MKSKCKIKLGQWTTIVENWSWKKQSEKRESESLNEHKWKHSRIQLKSQVYPVKMAHGGGPSKRKSNLHIDDSSSEESEVPPPDGGWGWVGTFEFLFALHPDLLDVQTTWTNLCYSNEIADLMSFVFNFSSWWNRWLWLHHFSYTS